MVSDGSCEMGTGLWTRPPSTERTSCTTSQDSKMIRELYMRNVSRAPVWRCLTDILPPRLIHKTVLRRVTEL